MKLSMGFSFPELLKTVYATFLKDCITCFSELYMQSFFVIDLYRIGYEVCMNFKLCTNAQRTIVPGLYIRKYLISSNMLFLVRVRSFSNLICNQKVHMQSASLIPPDYLQETQRRECLTFNCCNNNKIGRKVTPKCPDKIEGSRKRNFVFWYYILGHDVHFIARN